MDEDRLNRIIRVSSSSPFLFVCMRNSERKKEIISAQMNGSKENVSKWFSLLKNENQNWIPLNPHRDSSLLSSQIRRQSDSQFSISCQPKGKSDSENWLHIAPISLSPELPLMRYSFFSAGWNEWSKTVYPIVYVYQKYPKSRCATSKAVIQHKSVARTAWKLVSFSLLTASFRTLLLSLVGELALECNKMCASLSLFTLITTQR